MKNNTDHEKEIKAYSGGAHESEPEDCPRSSFATCISEISRYGNVTLAATPAELTAAGFEPADIILVQIGEHEMEMPVGTCYNDADSGEPVCCLLADPDGGSGWTVLAVNAGNMAAEMELTGTSGGEADIHPTPVLLSMLQKQGFLDEYRLHRVGSTRTNRRTDYAALSDEDYANFREIRTAGIAPGRLYRSSSPINPALNRNREADAALQRAGIRTVINMTDSDEKMKRCAGYPDSAYSRCEIAALDMGMDFLADDFKRKLADGFRFMTAHDGPYLIHCTEGKDRAGFAAALLECLMGAGMEEITADYMRSFINYYGIMPGTEQYDLISGGNIQASLAKAFGAGMKSDDGKCLSECAERFLRSAGMNRNEIYHLKSSLKEVM